MRFKNLAGIFVAVLLTLGVVVGSAHVSVFAQSAPTPETVSVAVGPQFDTTHVYVAPEDFDRFVASLIATFGGTTNQTRGLHGNSNAKQYDVAAGPDACGLGLGVRL
jgi:hypothetical protein